MKNILKSLFLFFLILVLVGFIFFKYQIRDRHSGYNLYQKISNKMEGQIQAGFAAVSITPEIVDTWNDTDGNASYEPKKGDTFNDNNNNGKFDAFWIAGFHNRTEPIRLFNILCFPSIVKDELAVLQQSETAGLRSPPALPLLAKVLNSTIQYNQLNKLVFLHIGSIGITFAPYQL